MCEVPLEYLFLRVKYYEDNVQATGWAMEHLRRSFVHAWLEFTARGRPEPNISESTWVAENYHWQRVSRLQEDFRVTISNNTLVEQFPIVSNAKQGEVRAVHGQHRRLVSPGGFDFAIGIKSPITTRLGAKVRKKAESGKIQ